eukprot:TRINITY_DN2457_c0_g1_i1.p3 TRINITY_DN2457_c0_g1~~TRINITY_DN2457_c0_g1_i1.p3  ORF type:complete len:139 (-),score=31.29 TRINITY_DN2457_c0_g1_i1:155-571(-)
MLKLKWLPIKEKTTRLAVLITDAPCHGKEFHDGVVDDYEDLTILKDADIRPQLDKMISQNINLTIIEINKTTAKMVKEISKHYEIRERLNMLQSLKLVDDLASLENIKIDTDTVQIQQLAQSLLERLELSLERLPLKQ